MKNNKVIFIAHQNQENLGVGYLSSVLISKGYDVKILDLNLPKEKICLQLKEDEPLLVGFSLIFQYDSFSLLRLARYLRENGVECHFTVGGHYPSLRFIDVLEIIPDIDSVVRFEGEFTVYELAESLRIGKDWRRIKGLAYRIDGKAVSNELRPLISNLDSLPFPLRSKNGVFQCMEQKYTHILASRGCIRNCSFCSVRKFYGTPPGKHRRTRSPVNLVKEMKELYEKNGVSIFLFQDDDFIFPGKVGRKWILDFIYKLENEGLAEKILWRISCRTDEVDLDLFEQLKTVGLNMVYLGIESGNEKGLKALNKQLTVEDHLKAVKTLNELKIIYDFGFMLFDPTSTFDSIWTNVLFLKKICGDGSSPVVFCKMVPYAETEIEKRLKIAGRLKGSKINPDYDFFDPKLDRYCEFLHRVFYEWMITNTGMLAKLRWNRFEVEVLKKFYPYANGILKYEDFLKNIVMLSNDLCFNIVEKAATIFQEKDNSENELSDLIEYKHTELNKINAKLYAGMVEFQKQQ